MVRAKVLTNSKKVDGKIKTRLDKLIGICYNIGVKKEGKDYENLQRN